MNQKTQFHMTNVSATQSWACTKQFFFNLLFSTFTCTVLFRDIFSLTFRMHTQSPLSSSLPRFLVKDRSPFLKSRTGVSPLSWLGFQFSGSSREREKRLCGSSEMRFELGLGKNNQSTPRMPLAFICSQEMGAGMEQGRMRGEDRDVY